MSKLFKGKLFIIAVVCIMVLSACSTNTSSNKGNSSPASQQGEQNKGKTTEATNEERVIKTVMGDVKIPAHPKRVVVQYLMGDLYAMGITPLAVSEVNEKAAFKALSSNSIDLGFHTNWGPEAVLALDPDLIIIIEKEKYDMYSQIAPTIYIPYEDEMAIEDRVTLWGEVFNEQQRASDVINKFKQNVEQAKAKLKAAGLYDKTITIMGGAKTPYISGKKYSIGALLYSTLGLNPPQLVQQDVIDKDEYWGHISMEVISKYTGDYIVYLEESDQEINAELQNDAIWNNLEAVKNNKIARINSKMSWYPDIYTLNIVLENTVDQLVKLAK
jgi:iron complex transport system substrate-binding protein